MPEDCGARSFLLLTAHTGNGHNAAAAAVAEALQSGQCRINLSHPIERAGAFYRYICGTYNWMLRRQPARMDWYYHTINRLRPNEWPAHFRFLRNWGRRLLAEYRPDVVVSLHPMTNHFFARLCKETRPQIPVACVVTDPGPDFWKGWSCTDVDHYFVATEAARQKLRALGIAVEKIEVTGMPIRSCFEAPTEPIDALRLRYGLEPNRFTLFFNAGWIGNRQFVDFYRRIGRCDLPIQLIYLHGLESDEEIRSANPAGRMRTLLIARTERMHELMQLSDLMVSKPGALTMFEAFAAGLPVAVNAVTPIMPQERGIAEWIRAREFGFWIEEKTQIVRLVEALLEEPRRLRRMRSNIRAFHNPGAAHRIATGLESIAGLITQRRKGARAPSG
ncbi:MAG TPA: glycosyltransferase [Acidobacteriota bacterium]|nr:glycosyltransferase [Acidobacteriota bacterium]